MEPKGGLSDQVIVFFEILRFKWSFIGFFRSFFVSRVIGFTIPGSPAVLDSAPLAKR